MTFDLELLSYALPLLWSGFLFTVQIGSSIALAAGILGALTSLALGSALPGVSAAARAYVSLMRGIPPLVLVLIAFYVLPAMGLILSPPVAGAAALTAYFAAYVGVAIRGAIAAVPPGQEEAALVLGMSRAEVLLRVVLPQAWPIALPALCGLLIGLFKETALLSVISVPELTFQTKQAVSRTYAPFEVYFLAALGYWAWSALLELAARRLEAHATRFRLPMTTTKGAEA